MAIAYVKIFDTISVNHAVYDNGRLDTLLGNLFKLNIDPTDKVFFFPGDEKGLQDFVMASFKILG